MRTGRQHRSGFTLVEMLIAVGVLGLLLSSLALMSLTGRDAYRTSQTSLDVETRTRRAIARVLDTLAPASAVSMEDDDPTAPEGASRLRFTPVVDIDAAGQPILGDPVRLDYAMDPGELDDGIDNDGDGLVDEGRLTLTRDEGTPQERTIVVCHNVAELLEGETFDAADNNGNGMVDEAGFVLRRDNALVTIWLTVQALNGNGEVVQRTVRTSLRLRNGL